MIDVEMTFGRGVLEWLRSGIQIGDRGSRAAPDTCNACAPCSLRKHPEIFCFTFIIRRSR